MTIVLILLTSYYSMGTPLTYLSNLAYVYPVDGEVGYMVYIYGGFLVWIIPLMY